jgi:hypothetical protein
MSSLINFMNIYQFIQKLLIEATQTDSVVTLQASLYIFRGRRKSIILLEGSQATPARPSGNFLKESRLIRISPYLKENTARHHDNDNLLNAVYTENHTNPLNTKRSVAYCYNRWYIYLPPSFKQLKYITVE